MAMKIPGYERQVGLGEMPNAKIAPMNNGGGEAIGRAWGGVASAIGQVSDVLLKEQEDKMATDVVAAQTEYQRRIQETLYNPEGGLLTRQGKNAESVHKDFSDMEKKIREEVTKNLPQYKKVHLAFNSFADRESMQGLGLAQRHQVSQLENYHWQTVDNTVAQNRMSVAQNYNDLGAINKGLTRIDELTAVMVTLKRGEEYGKAFAMQEKGKLLAEVVETAMTNGDDTSAQAALDAYSDLVDPSFINRYRATLVERAKEETINNTVQELQQKHGNNLGAILAEIESMDSLPGEEKDPVSSMAVAFGVQESGNNYGAKNGRTGAYGKYQIMPANWPSWSKEAFGKVVEQTPENQEKVGRYKMTQYWNKFKDPYLVAVAWYAGPGRAETLQKGGDELFKKVHGFSIYDKQGKGNEPSIDEYAKSVAGKFNGVNKSEAKPLDYATKERMINDAIQNYNRNEALINKQKQQIKQNGLSEMMSLYNSGVTNPKTYEAIAKKYGKDPEVFQSLLGDAKWFGNATAQPVQKMPWEAEVSLWYELQKGTNLSFEQYIGRVKQFTNDPEKLESFAKAYISRSMNTKAPDDGYKYNWSGLEKSFLVSNKLNPNKKPQDQLKLLGGIKYAKEKIDEFKQQHNGKSPSEAQVMQWMDESLTVAIPGTPGGWLGWGRGPDTTKGQLVLNNVSNVKLSSDGSTVLITMNDGTKQKMSRADFAKLMKK